MSPLIKRVPRELKNNLGKYIAIFLLMCLSIALTSGFLLAAHSISVIIDDMVDTANTLCAGAAALKEHGAEKVLAYCTHPVLSGSAAERVANSALDELVVTDTIPLSDAAKACGRIRQLSVAELLAETIRRIAFGESVSSLYVD